MYDVILVPKTMLHLGDYPGTTGASPTTGPRNRNRTTMPDAGHPGPYSRRTVKTIQLESHCRVLIKLYAGTGFLPGKESMSSPEALPGRQLRNPREYQGILIVAVFIYRKELVEDGPDGDNSYATSSYPGQSSPALCRLMAELPLGAGRIFPEEINIRHHNFRRWQRHRGPSGH